MGSCFSFVARAGSAVAAIGITVAVLSGCTSTSTATAAPTAGPVTPDAVISEPVPAASGGTVSETVAPGDLGATTSVDLTEPAELPDGVTVSVASATSVEVTAETPGEIAGPAVSIVLDVRNNSDAPIDLSTAMVSLTGADDAMGQPTTSAPYAPFTGTVEPGDTATGTYVFLLPAGEQSPLAITVEHVAGAPIALFTGDITKETR